MNDATDAVGIAAVAYRLPKRFARLADIDHDYESALSHSRSDLQIPKLGMMDLAEVEGVHIFEDEPCGALAMEAVGSVMQKRGVTGSDLGLIVDYSTVSRDQNGLTLGFRVQDELDAGQAMVLALGNGSCVSFHLALKSAAALMRSDEAIRFALLFSEDRVTGRRVNSPFNVLGDGASAVLLERAATSHRVLGTRCTSIGRFRSFLGINHWQPNNFNFDDFENQIVPVYYKVMRDLVNTVLSENSCSLEQVGLLLYQNMSLNDYRGLEGALGVRADCLYRGGMRGRGHVFGADLVINLALAEAEGRTDTGDLILMLSSGAGFSWGATLLAV